MICPGRLKGEKRQEAMAVLRKGCIALIICLLTAWGWAGPALAAGVYAETPLDDITDAQRNNIALAAQAIDGTRLSFGEEFSFNRIVGERSEARGFMPAVNGRGVEVTGGGVAQTATTLYLALMQRDDIGYSSIYTYNESFTGGYVDSGYDAIATDYAAGLDFAFDSFSEGALTIYMWLDDDSVCCYVAENDTDAAAAGLDRSGYSELPMGDSAAQQTNVRLAAMSIDGRTMGPGEVFLFNEIVGPRTSTYGYRAAQNGRGAEVVGGGVAQVASAVYLAVRDMDCVEIIEKRDYGDSYAGSYVDRAEDAVLVDYSGGIDFSFAYRGEGTLTVYLHVEEDRLVCEVYEQD